MWFWVQPEYNYPSSDRFHWKRDCIYIAVILLGFGGATLMVLSLSMVSILIGEYSVSTVRKAQVQLISNFVCHDWYTGKQCICVRLGAVC